MTFDLLNKVIIKNNIHKDVKLMSDSGWEFSATDMNGIYYNEKENVIVFAPIDDCIEYFNSKDWKILYGD